MNIATLQLSSLPISESKLDYYLRIAHSKGVEVVTFGEYVLNLFFKELKGMPIEMLVEQTNRQIAVLQEFADSYHMLFVAPVLILKSGKLYKSLVKIAPKKRHIYYDQQILIPFSHWNERAFFANNSKKIGAPLIFIHNKIKFAALFGYELHFDEIWLEIKRKRVDCVLLCSVSTFNSFERWREIIKTRAFLNSCAILRANRIGEYVESKTVWKFYGDSLFCAANGEIEDSLEDKEGLLVVNLNKDEIRAIKKEWAFRI